MKRLFFLFFTSLFLCNPAYLSAALWEYSAYGEIHNYYTDTRYNVTGNVLIDGTPEFGHYYYDHNISQYSIHVTEQWGSEHYYFYGSSGAFRVHYHPNQEFEDFTWGFNFGEGDFDSMWGSGFEFYHENGDHWNWTVKGYMTLAPQIYCYVWGLGGGGGPNHWFAGGGLNLTRTGSVQVPEPSTGILLAISIASVIFWRRKLR